MLSTVHARVEREVRFRTASSELLDSRIAITVCRPDQDGRKGPTSYRSEEVEFDGLEKFTDVISLLSHEEKEQLRLTLLRNIDVFAWRHSDMVGINPMVASHKLNVLPTAKPIRQKVSRLHPD